MTDRASIPGAAPHGRREELLAAVRAQRAGVTIYGLARALGRPYRRVFDAVRRLAAEGALRLEPVARNNRRATLVTVASGESRAEAALPAHLSDAERGALRAIAARLAALDVRIQSLILFGSRARGNSGPESDLDLAVGVRGRRDPKLERQIIAAFADVEWGVPLEGALRLSPALRFEGEPRMPLDEAVRAEGVFVWKRRR